MKLISLAIIAAGVSLSISAHAIPGLEVLTQQGYSVKQGTQKTIDNMPRVRSQDSAGLCYSFAASTLIDYSMCEERKANCQTLPDSQRTSALDISRFTKNLPEDVDHSDRFNYEGLNLEKGGSPALTLINALSIDGIITEECAPFDQFVSKLGTSEEQEKAELETFKQLKNAFEKNKKHPKKICLAEKKLVADFKNVRKAKSYPDTAAGEDERGNDSQRERQLTSDFETCAGEIMAKEVKNICALQASPLDAYYAFTEKTYSSFLDRLAVPEKCWDRKHQVKFRKKPELGIFPGYINNDIKRPAPTTAKKMSDHIQQLVDKKIPVLLSFCLDGNLPPPSKNCKNGHAVVISGSRQVCKGSDCKISFRVQSSWGQSWQDQNDDGWVDGEELIRRTSLDPLSLLYLEPKK